MGRPPKATTEFAGLTPKDCCAECREGHCVILGDLPAGTFSYCAHPLMSGLQARDKSNPTIQQRFNRAKRLLAHASVDKRVA